MKGSIRALSVVLSVFLLFLTACSSSEPATTAAKQPEPSSTAAPAPAAPAKAEKTTVKVGGTAMASLKHYPAIVANHPDIVGQTGIEIEFSELKSTGETRKQLQLGNLDFGFIISTDLMLDAANDIQIASVLSTSPLEALIVSAAYKDEIKSVKDLVGKPVGVSSIGSATHNMLNSILMLNGVDPTAVKVMPIGADVAKPFAEKQVVAAVTFEPYVFNLVESGKAVMLQDVRFGPDIKKIFGEAAIPWTILAVRREVAEKNPDLVKQVAAAIQAGADKMASLSPEEVISLLPAKMQTAENLALYKANRSAFPTDTTPKMNELQAVVDNMKMIKAIPSDYAPSADALFKK